VTDFPIDAVRAKFPRWNARSIRLFRQWAGAQLPECARRGGASSVDINVSGRALREKRDVDRMIATAREKVAVC